MEYTKEHIERIKADIKGCCPSSEPLAYVVELETRLKLINGAINELCQTTGFPPLAEINNDAVLLQESTEQREEPKQPTSAQNKADDKIRLYSGNWQGEDSAVVWHGFCGYDYVSLVVDTPDEARTLFQALLAVKEFEAD